MNTPPRAIERRAKLMGISPNDYLRQALAAVIAGTEEMTVITDKLVRSIG
jgi:hypothetical protein